MSRARDAFDSWLRDYVVPRYPTRVSELRELVSTFDLGMQEASLRADKLDRVIRLVEQDDVFSEFAAELLGDLALKHNEARRAIEALLSHRRLSVRVNALVALSTSAATEWGIQLYRRALVDKSGKVRTLAASHAERYRIRGLIADLSGAILRERDRSVRAQLERARNLLRDGHHAWVDERGQSWITRLDAKGSFATVPAESHK
jgi:hypothetical protein